MICAPLVERLATIVTATQHGFLPTRSIESNLISFIHNLSCSIEDSNSITATLYTDFAKVFDKVPHDVLLRKLANYGIGGRLLKLTSIYLSERQQFVKAYNVKSSFFYRLLVVFPRVLASLQNSFCILSMIFRIFLRQPSPTYLLTMSNCCYNSKRKFFRCRSRRNKQIIRLDCIE